MNTMRLRFIAISTLALCGALAGAQEKRDGFRDYDFVKAVTPVLNLSNPAALAGWDGKISEAAVRFDKADGALASLTESKDSYEVAAGTESYYRVSDRIAFFGHIDWSYFNGKEMGGPVLIDPEYNPFNLYENDPTTLGTRKRESYSLKGAMSYSFSDRWAAGLSVKFDGKDQTKLKDPRFLTYWTDLAFDAGLSFRPSPSVLLGASAFYRNTLESVQGGIYGKTDQSYFFQVENSLRPTSVPCTTTSSAEPSRRPSRTGSSARCPSPRGTAIMAGNRVPRPFSSSSWAMRSATTAPS